ncbi:hypothetical protein BC828DRAFT_406593 [Blastocladiella britannica]|nr:hypothetical protein BC828DRAFT_406593 [Blastocladiella britannica]
MQFEPLTSAVEPSFWHHLATLKLNVLKLDTQPLALAAHFEPARRVRVSDTDFASLPAIVQLDAKSFDPERYPVPSLAVVARGVLHNVNSIEDFKRLDKQAAFATVAATATAAIASGKWMRDPALLIPFLCVSYADLKKHSFWHWFGFPALVPKGYAVTVERALSAKEWAYSTRPGFLESAPATLADHARHFAFLIVPGDGDQKIRAAPLTDLPAQIAAGAPITVAFVDPSTLATSPGWPARNLLVALAHVGVRKCTLLAMRHDLSGIVSTQSEPPGTVSMAFEVAISVEGDSALDFSATTGAAVPATGWERTAEGKLAPRNVNLAQMMDPVRLADDAVSLNLKLMKWRVLPEIDLDAMANSKCLVLGAGTLGCYVARGLMAWGVKTVTMVDSGKVSFSNPVRQPLFTFEDCLDGGKPKAEAAAARVRDVLPTMNAEGIQMSIPMPGHPVLNESEFQTTVVALDAMVAKHDVIFLLMDSRESRWLPTVLGAAHNKIVINAALGFDSYVVMRHTPVLGCYYCNDVVAPADSLTDRTLDQMCTVTRPGLAAIASATAVELNAAAANDVGVLGIVPHQVRGFLHNLESMKIAGQAYDRCTGCSEKILDAWKTRGADFVREVCNDPATLERITGLDTMKQEAEEGMGWDVEESDDEAGL